MAPSTRPRKSGARSSSRRQNRKSYREDSTESDGSLSDDASEGFDPPASSSRRPRRAKKPGRPPAKQHPEPSRKRKSTHTDLPQSRNKRTRRSSPKLKDETIRASPTISSSGRIPPWQTLPYHVLLEIFLYTTGPYIIDSHLPLPSNSWLLQTALLCRAFAEPALSALYYNPSLATLSRFHGLLSHLEAQDDTSTFQYRSKIKFLELDARDTLFRKHRGQRPVSLGDLVRFTPLLQGISISERLSQKRNVPVFQATLSTVPKTKAAEAVKATLDTLQQQQIRLLEWKWNRPIVVGLGRNRFLAMKEYHEALPLKRLRTLTIEALDSHKASEKAEEALASAIDALTHLQELNFSITPLVNGTLLPLLPRNLQILSIVDCPVTGAMLSAFLDTHGQGLSHLTLNHNKSLNLSFTVALAQTCPSLKSLTMDLTYHDSHTTYSDSDPKFDVLLMPDEIPTWPMTLQKLELLHLRKWDCSIAENFFTSLIDAAPTLPDLRYLNIKASLNESGWRERVSFRDRWVNTIQKVFLRVTAPPNPYLRSIPAFRAYKASQAKTVTPGSARPIVSRKKAASTRKQLDRVEIPLKKGFEAKPKPANVSHDSDSSDEPLIRRSSRLKKSGAGSSTSDASPPRRRHRRRKRHGSGSEDESSSDDSALDDDASLDTDTRTSPQPDSTPGLYIQGMCDVVRISIDTLRPREEQLAESDFLDEEISGDEDWNGDNDDGVDGENEYAW